VTNKLIYLKCKKKIKWKIF